MGFCSAAFYNLEIHEDGSVYNCCAHFQNYIPLGNIFEKPFEEIWNSKRAVEIRRHLLKGDFSFCNSMCSNYNGEDEITPQCREYMSQYPLYLSLSTDNVCNVRCVFCRDKFKKSEISDKEFETRVEQIYLPIMKNAKYIRFGCTGEPFASNREKNLIKRIMEYNPDVKLNIFTNGNLGDKKTLEKYNLYTRINDLTVSIHAAKQSTYNKIVRGGNYKKLLKNLELYSEMFDKHLIKSLTFIFVVFSENYKEIPEFIEFAKKYNARPCFWAFRNNETVYLGKHYKDFSVIDSEHPKHKDLLRILNSTDIDKSYANFAPELSNLFL